MIDAETYRMFWEIYEQSHFLGIVGFLAYFIIYSSILLAITFLFFSVLPVGFAFLRRKPIKRKRFRVFCYCINIIAFVGNAFLGSGLLTIFGYIMWTKLGCLIGVKILSRRGKLDGEAPPDKPEKLEPGEVWDRQWGRLLNHDSPDEPKSEEPEESKPEEPQPCESASEPEAAEREDKISRKEKFVIWLVAAIYVAIVIAVIVTILATGEI